jgi:hypothetical protein
MVHIFGGTNHNAWVHGCKSHPTHDTTKKLVSWLYFICDTWDDVFNNNTFDKVEGHEYVIFKFTRRVVNYIWNIHGPKLCKNLISINQVFDTLYKLELHTIHFFFKYKEGNVIATT